MPGSRGSARALLTIAFVFACVACGRSIGVHAAAPPPPPASTGVATSEATEPAVAPANTAPQPSFDLLELRVLGNSVLDTRDIERTVYPFLGPGKTLKDVEAARAALEKEYHARGYGTVFVDIPEQSVDGGIVRLKVTEGKLGAVHVAGARYFSGRQIKAAMPEAAPGAVPQLPALQEQITAVNTVTPDRVVTPILKAGSAPGTVDLTLRVDDKLPLHASLEVNNDYTLDTSTLRAIAQLSYDNLFGRFDSLSLQYQTSPQDLNQVKVFVGSYITRLDDLRWSFYYLHSSSEVPTLAAATAATGASSLLIVGKGSVYGTRLLIPLPATATTTQNLNIGAEYKDFLQNISSTPLDPQQSSSVLETPVRYINFSLGYGGYWRGTGRLASLDSSVNFAVRGLGNSPELFENKRFDAKSNYFYLKSAASFTQTLPWNFSGLVRFAGQYAVEPLVSNEQFAIAGSDGVRGYLEAEVLADAGFKSTLQFGSPPLNFVAGKARSDAFVFLDYGRVNLIHHLAQEPGDVTLSSAGAGFNLSFFDHFSGILTWAYPMANGSVTRLHDSRFLFSVRSSW